MKLVAILLLASLPVPQVSSPVPQLAPHLAQPTAKAPRKGGKWYMARTGHAVYCYGPVMNISNALGGIDRVATLCRGEKIVVPLKD
jgi:hypothetical protein